MGKPRLVKTIIPLTSAPIHVYAGTKVASALEAFLGLGMYEGVKIADLLSAVYEQGKKDGAAHAKAEIDYLFDRIKHRKPGRPPKRKRQKK